MVSPEARTQTDDKSEQSQAPPPLTTGTNETSQSSIAQDELIDSDAEETWDPEPAKKKKKKKKGRRGKVNPQPTGFEDAWIEPPLTEEQYKDDLEVYSPTKPFAERIEICIQRYKAKRRFDATRNQIFEAYLQLGGISVGAKKFSGGLDIKPNDDRDAEEIARFTATDYVDKNLSNVGRVTELVDGVDDNRDDDDDDDDEQVQFVVDFDFVVRGFLSHKVPYVLCLNSPTELQTAVKTIRNFLNFVMYHNVCPEFNDNIKQAVSTCSQAEKELPLCRMISDKFPGEFNKSCSTLFGGYYQHLVPTGVWEDNGSSSSNNNSQNERTFISPVPVGYTKEEAKKVYLNGIEQIDTLSQSQPQFQSQPQSKREEGDVDLISQTKTIYKEHISLRITELRFPPEGTPKHALGRIHVVLWNPEEQDTLASSTPLPFTVVSKWNSTDGFSLMIEKHTLQYCFEGMCFNCTVHELNNGLIYFDQVTAVMTSFYLELNDEKAEAESSDYDFD